MIRAPNEIDPTGGFTINLHPDVRRVSGVTEYMVKDHQASNRVIYREGNTVATRHDCGPYGLPLSGNGAAIPVKGKSYINERFDLETGLQYLHTRRASVLNRFLSPSEPKPHSPSARLALPTGIEPVFTT